MNAIRLDFAALIASAALLVACGAEPGERPGADDSPEPSESEIATTPTPSEGSIEVPGGSVWYRVDGDRDGVPLLLLHGGPGAGSGYFEPLAALGDDRPVVFYDQLGAGRSERPTDPANWTIERHIAEHEKGGED